MNNYYIIASSNQFQFKFSKRKLVCLIICFRHHQLNDEMKKRNGRNQTGIGGMFNPLEYTDPDGNRFVINDGRDRAFRKQVRDDLKFDGEIDGETCHYITEDSAIDFENIVRKGHYGEDYEKHKRLPAIESHHYDGSLE